MGAGLLALGSKAAMIAKSGGGLSGLAKGAGLLAVGGMNLARLQFYQNCKGCFGSKSCTHLKTGVVQFCYRRCGSCSNLEAWRSTGIASS